MSNKLKTLSSSQLETLIKKQVDDYIKEDCTCSVSHLSTPNIDSEEDLALEDTRSITFEVKLSYKN